MNYTETTLEDLIQIDSLYTVHYFEYSYDFRFAGESHDFWEFVCVDKGMVRICMDTEELVLHKGDIAFHQPGEFHKVEAMGTNAPNLVVISFASTSPIMEFFQKKCLRIDERERSILAEILLEARKLFRSPLDDPFTTHMEKSETAPIGSEQLLKIELQYFLLHLLRRYYDSPELAPAPLAPNNTEIFKRVVTYMENHVNAHLTMEQICHENMVGRTHLQKIFHNEANTSVMDYFSHIKIDAAKHLIRSGTLNFTQISEQLGYASIHYFSRQFKKISGMTPSDYASSIKALTDKHVKNALE